MKIIGLTGGIASGKSTVSTVLKELGAEVIDVDIIARKVVSKGEKSYNKIIECFGDEVLLPNSEINRRKLGSIVFSDRDKLEQLNNITHPEIINYVKKQIEDLKKSGSKVIVVDAAILIEMGLHEVSDEIWLVLVNKETQIKRLIDRDKFAYNEAENRVNSQYSNEEKVKYADVVIDNSRPVEEVKDKIRNLWNNIVSRGE